LKILLHGLNPVRIPHPAKSPEIVKSVGCVAAHWMKIPVLLVKYVPSNGLITTLPVIAENVVSP